MRYASGLPLSEAERQRCAARQAQTVAIKAARRKACRSGHHYDQPGTPESAARDQRIMGEFDDD